MDRIVPSEGIDVGSIPAGRIERSYSPPVRQKGVGESECAGHISIVPDIEEGLGKPLVPHDGAGGHETSADTSSVSALVFGYLLHVTRD